MIQQMLAVDSGSSAFSKTSLNIWKFMVHVLLKPGLENFEHYFASMWYECNYVVVCVFFGIAFLWDWNENWPFPVLWPLLSFPNLLAYWMQHFHSIIFQNLKYLNWNFITSTSFGLEWVNLTQMWNLNYDTNELIYETETDSQAYRTNLWLPRGREVGGGVWD